MKTVDNIYRSISALVWKEGLVYVSRAVEVEVASQGKTKQEALDNLKEALELYFDDTMVPQPRESYQNVTLEKVTIKYA